MNIQPEASEALFWFLPLLKPSLRAKASIFSNVSVISYEATEGLALSEALSNGRTPKPEAKRNPYEASEGLALSEALSNGKTPT